MIVVLLWSTRIGLRVPEIRHPTSTGYQGDYIILEPLSSETQRTGSDIYIERESCHSQKCIKNLMKERPRNPMQRMYGTKLVFVSEHIISLVGSLIPLLIPVLILWCRCLCTYIYITTMVTTNIYPHTYTAHFLYYGSLSLSLSLSLRVW
jgi:hypothetical protein